MNPARTARDSHNRESAHVNATWRLGGPALRFVAFLVTWVGLLVAARTAHAADFEIRRVSRDGEDLVIYHDPVRAAGPVQMDVNLSRGGCDVDKPSVNVRQAGDSFATLIAIDRGDPAGLGRWSKEILGGVGDFLRVELMTARPNPDEYALLDSYGTPPPREQPLTSSLPTLESFLSTAPKPQAAGAAIYRRTLDATRLLESTGKPLRAMVIVSDGADPNLYPGGVAEDTLLIERSKQLGAPIFAVIIARKPQSNAHRSALQAAATRLQSVAVRSGGGVIREIPADDTLRSQLAQALASFSAAIGSWQRTECSLCGDVTSGDVAVELVARQEKKVVARSRQPFTTKLAGVGELPKCERCNQASDCSCQGDKKADCKDGKCRCEGECSKNDDCKDGQVCKKGQCETKIPWLIIGAVLTFLLLLLGGLVVAVSLVLRARNEEARRREEEERRRRDAEAFRAREDDERRRREEQDRLRREDAERRRAQDAARAAAPPIPAAPAAPAAPPAAWRLHSRTAGYSDVALPEGATVIGGDQQEVMNAVRRLPPTTPGHPVVIAAATVSGKHAVVRVTGASVTVTDFGSTNGTIVNGVRIQPNAIVELRPGDQVELSRQLVFVLEPVGGHR